MPELLRGLLSGEVTLEEARASDVLRCDACKEPTP